MPKFDLTWRAIFSDLLVNLAAGWFGSVLIAPNFSPLSLPEGLAILTVDIIAGTLCLLTAYRLKKSIKQL